MYLFMVFALLCSVVLSLPKRQWAAPQHAICRFSPEFEQDEIMKNSTDFEESMFYWEGQFHKDGIGYLQSNGITISRRLLGYTTGLPISPPVLESNPQVEAYHIMLLTHAMARNPLASTFIYAANPQDAAQWAAAILSAKLKTYLDFNATYPAYMGFLPHFTGNSTKIWPAMGFDSKLSAADNGQLVWAVYGLINVLTTQNVTEYTQLAQDWSKWFLHAGDNAKAVFMQGPEIGDICAISQIILRSGRWESVCEDDSCLNNDPFEGELMTWFLAFAGNINNTAFNAMFNKKSPQLLATNYTGSTVDTSRTRGGPIDYHNQPIVGRHIMPITVQKGRYFGSNEQIKLLYLPYLDIPIVQRVYKNAERVRTCNSVLMGKTPGMFASVTNATSPRSFNNVTYVNNAGIPSAAVFEKQELDMITPYSVFPTILFNRAVGLAWYKNMLDGKSMQTIYGSTAASRRDGSAISAVLSWETKAPTLLALLGGITDFVREGLQRDELYGIFFGRNLNDYGLVFDSRENGGAPLTGEDIEFCLPDVPLFSQSLLDFSTCNRGDVPINSRI